MKKILLLFIFVLNLYADYDNYELKLYEKILPLVFADKLLIFTDSNTNIIKHSNTLKITRNCERADLLIGKDFTKLYEKCKMKPVFSTSYRSFKNTPNCIGAFYWRKGRPQIKFNLDVIEKFGLLLPKGLREFAK